MREAAIPEWIPTSDRARLDLGELADCGEPMRELCSKLGDQLGVWLAAYRRGATARPNGLCCTFRYAELTAQDTRMLTSIERDLDGIVLVAYARPLQRW